MDQRTYVSYLEILSTSQQPGATDIRQAISANFPEGLAASRAEFSARLAEVQKPSLESLGPVLNLKDCAVGSTLAVYDVNLSTAHESIKVGLQSTLNKIF